MLLNNMDNQEVKKERVEKNGNGNRRYSMLLLALLFIGMGTYGTYAYFTDSTSVDGQIELKTGTVSLGEAPTGEWVYGHTKEVLENTARKEAMSENQFTNLQPGDFYTKIVEVAYKGTLDAQVTAKINGGTELKKDGFTYTVALDGLENGKVSAGGDKQLTVTIKASVDYSDKEEKFGENSRNKAGGTELNLLDVADLVTITAEQIRK